MPGTAAPAGHTRLLPHIPEGGLPGLPPLPLDDQHLARPRRTVLGILLGLSVLVSGCDLLLERPPTPEVMRALPLADDAVVHEAGCVGTPRERGYLCVVKARSPSGMEAASAEASRRMAAWREYSWDRVPGRIQWSWTRDKEAVSLAIHDQSGTSLWSLSYHWDPGEAQPIPNAMLSTPADPDAKLPEELAALPLPEGARLLRAGCDEGRVRCQASFEVGGAREGAIDGDPRDDLDEAIATWASMPGWTTVFESRGLRSRAVSWRREGRELAIVLLAGEDGRLGLAIHTRPAI